MGAGAVMAVAVDTEEGAMEAAGTEADITVGVATMAEEGVITAVGTVVDGAFVAGVAAVEDGDLVGTGPDGLMTAGIMGRPTSS